MSFVPLKENRHFLGGLCQDYQERLWAITVTILSQGVIKDKRFLL
jgi:hypothetical protein